jgi:hypothetical protein
LVVTASIRVHRFSAQSVALEQHVAVIHQIGRTGVAHAMAQSALQHGDLAGGHLDAAVILDEIRQSAEIRLPQAFDRRGGKTGHQ